MLLPSWPWKCTFWASCQKYVQLEDSPWCAVSRRDYGKQLRGQMLIERGQSLHLMGHDVSMTVPYIWWMNDERCFRLQRKMDDNRQQEIELGILIATNHCDWSQPTTYDHEAVSQFNCGHIQYWEDSSTCTQDLGHALKATWVRMTHSESTYQCNSMHLVLQLPHGQIVFSTDMSSSAWQTNSLQVVCCKLCHTHPHAKKQGEFWQKEFQPCWSWPQGFSMAFPRWAGHTVSLVVWESTMICCIYKFSNSRLPIYHVSNGKKEPFPLRSCGNAAHHCSLHST